MKVFANKKGMTLIEILITLAIFGVILSSMYGVYISMNNASVNEQAVVDIQQNLRVALELIGHDIKMAGALIPSDELAVSAATDSSLTLQTASGLYAFATLSDDLEVEPGNAFPIQLPISMPTMVDSFSANDTVRVIRPQTGEQPYPFNLEVVPGFDPDDSRKIPSVTLKAFNPTSAVQYKAGDLLVRVRSTAAAPNPSQIVWNRNATNLQREGDAGGVETVADNITDLSFEYIIEGKNTPINAPTAAELADIKAIRVTLTSQTPNQTDGSTRTRSLASIYYLRNKTL